MFYSLPSFSDKLSLKLRILIPRFFIQKEGFITIQSVVRVETHGVKHHTTHRTKGSKDIALSADIGSKEEGHRKDGDTVLAVNQGFFVGEAIYSQHTEYLTLFDGSIVGYCKV